MEAETQRDGLALWSLRLELGRPAGALLGKGPAGQADDLEGADNTTRVEAVNPLVCGRVTLGQFAQQLGHRRGLEGGAHGGIGRRGLAQSLEQGLEVEPRAAA